MTAKQLAAHYRYMACVWAIIAELRTRRGVK